jgi:hypothetical protein
VKIDGAILSTLNIMANLYVNRSDGHIEQVMSQMDVDAAVLGFIASAIEGGFFVLCNFPIVLVIFLTSTLRSQKEYIIVAGLAFAYGLYGLAFLVAGILRTNLVYQGNGNILFFLLTFEGK